MQSSAFDEALCSPFLQEKTHKKKWSFTSTSSTESTTSIQSIIDHDEDLEGQFFESLKLSDAMLDMETVVFDDALISERHGEIKDINESMKQLNTISKGEFYSNELVEASLVDIRDSGFEIPWRQNPVETSMEMTSLHTVFVPWTWSPSHDLHVEPES